MITAIEAAPEAISNLLTVAEEYPAPQVVAGCAKQQDWVEEHGRSVEIRKPSGE